MSTHDENAVSHCEDALRDETAQQLPSEDDLRPKLSGGAAKAFSLFSTGEIVVSLRAFSHIEYSDIIRLYKLHIAEHWVDVSGEQRAQNLLAIRAGRSIASAHRNSQGGLFTVTTDGQRSLTIIDMPRKGDLHAA